MSEDKSVSSDSQHPDNEAAERRFWSKVKKSDGCWTWGGHRNSRGYGKIIVRGVRKSVHRFSWEIHSGEIPAGMVICHKCDNPPCVNPDHLFLGTQQDNIADMYSKGRDKIRFGERVPGALVTEKQVLEIRRRYIKGKKSGPNSVKAIAADFGISKSQVRKIANGTNWRHVE